MMKSLKRTNNKEKKRKGKSRSHKLEKQNLVLKNQLEPKEKMLRKEKKIRI